MKKHISILVLTLALTPRCNGNIEELDACHDVADALCARAEQCGGEADMSGCRAALATRCESMDALALEDPDGCAADLDASCGETLPKRCEGLTESMGCDLCGSETPPPGMVRACCEVDPWSPVCGGC